MLPEWLVCFVAGIMWVMGFLTCGAAIGNGPFWDGVRRGLLPGWKG